MAAVRSALVEQDPAFSVRRGRDEGEAEQHENQADKGDRAPFPHKAGFTLHQSQEKWLE